MTVFKLVLNLKIEGTKQITQAITIIMSEFAVFISNMYMELLQVQYLAQVACETTRKHIRICRN